MRSRISDRLNFWFTFAATALLAASPAVSAEPPKDDRDTFRAFVLSTGEPGGIYLPLGRSLCHLYNRDRPPEMPICLAMKSGGSIDNIDRLRNGTADMALVQSDVAHWARSGEGPFSNIGAFSELRLLFPVHDETITILVKQDVAIHEISDFLGKRIAIAGSKTGSHATTEALLQALGWKPDDFRSYTSEPMADEIEALCRGQTDITILVVGHPNGFVQRALSECDARLERFAGSDVESALEALPFLHMGSVEAGRYKSQTSAVPVPALAAMLVVRASLSNAVVERFASTLFSHEETLRKLHPAFSMVNLRRKAPVMKDIEPHPGLPLR